MENIKKIAYLIVAHNDPSHLFRLIKRLNYQADFFIHIDKKTALDPFLKSLGNTPNVYFIPEKERIPIHWAGFSQVQATLKLIELVLSHATNLSISYAKIVLLSGSCYPIKPASFIVNFFNQHDQINFIRGMDISTPNHPKYNYSICRFHFFIFNLGNPFLTRLLRKILFICFSVFRKKRFIQLPSERLPVIHGSSWWALNMDVLVFIRDYVKAMPGFSSYFKFSMASDEKFFHTIFFHSPFASSSSAKGLEPFFPHTSAFANLHIIHKSLTKWYGIRDWNEIKDSDMLFVRKVSTTNSQDLLDRIDKECHSS